MSATVFLDTETDGLHPHRKVWEVAMIRRDDQGQRELQFFVQIDLRTADPAGLRIGGFYDRHPFGRKIAGKDPMSYPDAMPFSEVCLLVARWTHGATIVGAVPSFDTEVLASMLRANGLIPAWHYRLMCVESLVAGYLGGQPGGLANSAKAMGIDVDPAYEHTALGDARTTMRIWDAVMGGAE